MTKENKDLLLKDLCARLPYGVKVQSTFYNCDGTIWKYENEILTAGLLGYPIKRYTPYLFPLSSMTEEQRIEASLELGLREYKVDIFGDIASYDEIGYDIAYIYLESIARYIDWLNKNHFDYRGLIPMGLAIDATGLNIY